MKGRENNLRDRSARINATSDIGNSYAVEAGAGTGKTTILLERVQNILLQEKASLSEIVLITFTEKAAAELKIKLRNRLQALYRDPGNARIIGRALEEYEKSTISTIHSFAASMLRERPVEAKINPGFEVADALTSTLFFDEIWQEWIEDQMENAPEALRSPLHFDVRLPSIKETAALILLNRDIRDGKPAKENVSLSDRIAQLEKISSELVAIAERFCVENADKGYRQIVDFHAIVQRLHGMNEEQKKRELFDMSIIPARGAQANWSDPSQLKRAKELFKEVSAITDHFRHQLAQNICADIAAWLDGFIDHYDAQKKKRGYLDFEDLLIHARDMLKENMEVREYFQKRYKYILVDEFQDTDPLQAEIVFFLSEIKPKAKNWEEVKVKKGKLFIVGDPKQSIYRFRRADTDIYAAAKNILVRDGREENVFVNFRTVPSIVRWVNETFSDLMGDAEMRDVQVGYIPIEPDRDEERNESNVILLYPSLEEEISIKERMNIGEIRAVESRYIASFVRHAVEKKWKVKDKKTGFMRDARFSDFAILFRKTTGMSIYEESLRAFDVPYRIVGGKHFFRKQEVMSLIAVMKAIDNPLDETSVVAALRSEFFGHSDEEIFLFRENGGSFDSMRQEREDLPINVSLNLLRDLHEELSRKEIADVLMNIFQRTKVLELFYLKPQGEQRIANLLKIVSMARMHERIHISSFKSFAAWLKEMFIEEREGEESPVSEEDDDAVRVMTIHKAKGLEFPFVIIAFLESGQMRSDTFIVDRKMRKFEFSLGQLIPTRFLELKEIEERRKEAEEQRVFYVAATRTRDKLILPIFPKKWKNGFIEYLCGRVPENRSEFRGMNINSQHAFFFDDGILEKQMKELKPFRIDFNERSLNDDFSEIIGKRDVLLNRISESKRNARKGLAAVSATSLKEEISGEREIVMMRSLSRGTRVGSAVHEILAMIDLKRPISIRNSEFQKSLEILYPGISTEVIALVEKARVSRTLKEAVSAKRMVREMPFSIDIGERLLEGAIDMLFERNGEFIAVDFKTDSVTDEKQIDKRMSEYTVQAAIYSLALSFLPGIHVKEIRFLFLNAGEERVITIDRDIIERGRSIATSSSLPVDFET